MRDERPSPVRIDGAPLRDSGWRLADANVFGELATSYLLRVGADPALAADAAAGWDGDRYELWRRDVAPGDCEYPCRADLALATEWAFDTEADAGEFERAAVPYLEQGLDARALGGGAWSLDGGYAALAASGRDVALVFAPQRGLARRRRRKIDR